MNAAKYLFPVWTGVLIYALLSVFFGPAGISAQTQLEKEREKQEANITELKNIHRDLEGAMNSLLYDQDTVAVYAREQGYVSVGERFIRIVGLGVNRRSASSSGRVLAAAAPQYTPDKTFRIIAVCSALTIFICMAVFDFLKNSRER